MTTKAADVDMSIDHDSEPENLIVFYASEDGGDAMILDDFMREGLAQDLEAGEYGVVPANESGVPQASRERLSEILTEVWGYSPLSE